MRATRHRRYDSPVHDPDTAPPPRTPTPRRPRPGLLRGDATAALLEEFVRFWSFVEAESEDGCWRWRGKVRPDGYGVFRRAGGRAGGGQEAAHHYAYRVVFGPPPARAQVKPGCGLRLCVNPWHQRRAQDRRRPQPLGRRAVAAGRSLAALRRERGLSQAALAGRAGISTASVSLLESGRRRPAPGTREGLATALGLDPAALERLWGEV